MRLAACYIDHRDILDRVRKFGSHGTILRRNNLSNCGVPLYTCDNNNAWHDAVLHECMMREACYVADNPDKTLQDLLHYDRVMIRAESLQEITRLEAELVEAHMTIKALKDQLK